MLQPVLTLTGIHIISNKESHPEQKSEHRVCTEISKPKNQVISRNKNADGRRKTVVFACAMGRTRRVKFDTFLQRRLFTYHSWLQLSDAQHAHVTYKNYSTNHVQQRWK